MAKDMRRSGRRKQMRAASAENRFDERHLGRVPRCVRAGEAYEWRRRSFVDFLEFPVEFSSLLPWRLIRIQG